MTNRTITVAAAHIAMATARPDALITAHLDVSQCTLGRTAILAFEKRRRPESCQHITSQVGAADPRVWRRPER